MRETLFSFEALEQHLASEAKNEPAERGSTIERIALLATLAGGALGIGVALLTPTTTMAIGIMLAGLGVEVCGIVVYAFINMRRAFVSFRNANAELSRDIDRDYLPYQRIVGWLRSFPKNDLREQLAYLQHRQSTMSRRTGILLGSAERLGILPVVVAVWLQLKNLAWPPSWSTWEAVAAIGLITFYGMTYWVLMSKLRLDLYASLLEASVGKPPSPLLLQSP